MLPALAMLPLALASASTAAAAAGVPISDREGSATSDFDGPPRHRNGITLGLTLGAALGGGSGYPNNSEEIGNPADDSSSGLLLGQSFTLLVMGALADYLNFGFWGGSTTYRSADWRSMGGGGGLRVEVFPLAVLYPGLEGLGVLGQFGIGSARLTSTLPGKVEASGTQSFAAGGAFYEWSVAKLLGGHCSLGPSLEYDAMWSLPFERHGLVASARVVFYGGP